MTNVALNCPFPTAYAVGGSLSGVAGNGLRLEYAADYVSLPAALTLAAHGTSASTRRNCGARVRAVSDLARRLSPSANPASISV